MYGRAEDLAPMARSKGLVVRELNGEILIFDREGDVAYCLNATVGAVWKHCDGKTAVPDIAELVSEEIGQAVTASTIFKALDQLWKDHLLQDKAAAPSTISRRTVLKRGVAAAVAIPVITSLAMSTPAFADSCTPSNACNGGPTATGFAHGCACTSDAQCCGAGQRNTGCCYNGGAGSGVAGVCRVCSSPSPGSTCANGCQGLSGDPGFPGTQCCSGV